MALRTKEFNVARVMCSPTVNLGTSSPLYCGVRSVGNPSHTDLCARFLKLEVTEPDALPLIYWYDTHTGTRTTAHA